jgi:hypothetical protein
MVKIEILGHGLTDEVKEKLIELLHSSGCEDRYIEVVQTIPDPDPDCDDEIVVVFATPDVCADPNLEGELTQAQNGGRRAICIWPEGSTTGEVPAAAAKYAYSIVPWDSHKLKKVVADDDFTCFETPTGEPLPTVETERNLCVDEPKTK